MALAVAFWPTTSPTLEFNARDWILVTEFDNRTGEAVLDGTLDRALARELSNSQIVNVVPPERVRDVLRLMRQPPDAAVDRDLGLEVSLRDGDIRVVLWGQVEKLDSTYVLSATVVDPATGVALASVQQEAQDQRTIVVAVQRLSNDVRETLGEAIASVAQGAPQLEKVTTPSLKALQLYSQADAVIAGRGGPGGDAIAEELLKQAVSEDPEFASAYIHLAHAIRNQRRAPEEYRRYAERAFRLAGTTSDRERYFILGSYHSMFARGEEAIAAYEVLIRLHPDHYWATNNLIGQYDRLGRPEEALRHGMRRADLRPHDFDVNADAAHRVMRLGADVALARPYAERARQLEIAGARPGWGSPHWVALFPVYDHWLANDPSAALETLTALAESVRSADRAERDGLAEYVGAAYLMLGALEAAEDVIESVVDDYKRQGGLAEIAWARGDRQAAAEHARHTPLLNRAMQPFAEARWLREFLDSPQELSPILSDPLMQIVRGRMALDRGDTAEAISLLESGLEALPTLFRSLVGVEPLANAWRQQGNLGRALQVLDEASRLRPALLFDTAYRAGDWLRLEAERAQLNRELGRDEKAAELEAQLLQLLARADPDHPILRELKARRAAVTTAAPSAN